MKTSKISWLDHPARDPHLLPEFKAFLRGIPKARVLEMGAHRSKPDISTLHRDWAAADAEFIGTDIEGGTDVDVVANAHKLSASFQAKSIDGVISTSVFEHLERPWVVAKEMAKILRPGGQVFVYTHFAFPYHGYPADFWRFTKEGLELIFKDAGFEIIGSDYENPARIVSTANPITETIEVFTGVRLVARRPLKQRPKMFRYLLRPK